MVNRPGTASSPPGGSSTAGGDRSEEGLEARVWHALGQVPDPEIPPCSITDLGIVERVWVGRDSVEVDLLPTFAGCPALDVIREDAEAAVRRVGGAREVRVRFVYAPPWTSDRITPKGREALRSYGLTPPELRPAGPAFIPLAGLGTRRRNPPCPYCGGEETVLESAFGPTLCRSTHFCPTCRNPFEAFKPKQGV
jgi:ring-1,2-phenylacetyl-CoA epoxidase subunit PaaD